MDETTRSERPLLSLIMQLKRCCQVQEAGVREALGLSDLEYRVLGVLGAAGALSSGELARAMGLSPSRTSRLVDDLLSRGLLTRGEGENRRTSRIALTVHGQRVAQRIAEGLDRCERKLQEGLSRAEYQHIQTALQRIVEVANGQ